MAYLLGMSAIKALVNDGDSLAYFRAKLNPKLFKGEEEQQLFDFVDGHFQKYRVMPKPETILEKVPNFAEIEAPEGPAFYLDKLQQRFEYDQYSRMTSQVHDLLKEDKTATDKAKIIVEQTLHSVVEQKHRRQILDMGKDGKNLLMTAYKSKLTSEVQMAVFGWPYMDTMTHGIGPGEIVSYVGRPAQGKTWFMLYGTLHNWRQGMNVLFVSMEMNTLHISQRLGSVYAGVSVAGLKEAALSTPQFKRLNERLTLMESEKGKLYVLDGNLAANIEDIYALAYQLGCQVVYIDGAYLVRSVNPRLNRFERVAENAEYMKRASGEIEAATFASWQFTRDSLKKDVKKGQKVGVEDIGMSDSIGQVSSVALGLLQEEGVETINKRKITVMKGRNGEVGSFEVQWLFDTMNFDQVPEEASSEKKTLEFI